ncbi:MAG: sigma-70 family RNA polymerase sigma factor [Solirubrobacteraceae bacterium]
MKNDYDQLEQILRSAEHFPLLDHETVVGLAQRIEKGDLAAKEKLINSNLRLVVSIARNYQGQGLALGDLVQEGMLGLIRAAEKYDYRKGFRFSTYATIWIRQALQRGLDNTGRTVRLPAHVAQRVRKLRRVERELAVELGEAPSSEKLAEVLETDLDEIGRLRDYDRVLASLDAGVGEEEDTPLGALIPVEGADTEQQVLDTVHGQELRIQLNRLPQDERQVLDLRFGTGREGEHSVEQTARKLGVPVKVARELERRALERLSREPEVAALREVAA